MGRKSGLSERRCTARWWAGAGIPVISDVRRGIASGGRWEAPFGNWCGGHHCIPHIPPGSSSLVDVRTETRLAGGVWGDGNECPPQGVPAGDGFRESGKTSIGVGRSTAIPRGVTRDTPRGLVAVQRYSIGSRAQAQEVKRSFSAGFSVRWARGGVCTSGKGERQIGSSGRAAGKRELAAASGGAKLSVGGAQ